MQLVVQAVDHHLSKKKKKKGRKKRKTMTVRLEHIVKSLLEVYV